MLKGEVTKEYSSKGGPDEVETDRVKITPKCSIKFIVDKIIRKRLEQAIFTRVTHFKDGINKCHRENVMYGVRKIRLSRYLYTELRG